MHIYLLSAKGNVRRDYLIQRDKELIRRNFEFSIFLGDFLNTAGSGRSCGVPHMWCYPVPEIIDTVFMKTVSIRGLLIFPESAL